MHYYSFVSLLSSRPPGEVRARLLAGPSATLDAGYFGPTQPTGAAQPGPLTEPAGNHAPASAIHAAALATFRQTFRDSFSAVSEPIFASK